MMRERQLRLDPQNPFLNGRLPPGYEPEPEKKVEKSAEKESNKEKDEKVVWQSDATELNHKRDAHIFMDPPVEKIVPGSKVTYGFYPGFDALNVIKRPEIKHKWYIEVDTTHMEDHIIERFPFREGKRVVHPGSDDLKWEMNWGPFKGNHVVACEVKIGDSEPVHYKFIQQVVEPAEKAAELFDNHSFIMQPDVYHGMLQLRKIELEKLPLQNKEKLENINSIIEEFKEKLEITDLQSCDGYEAYTNRAIRALLIPDARPTPVPLTLFIKPTENGWAIIDGTDPNSMRVYHGKSSENLQGEEAIRSAIKNAWEKFIEDNNRPEGQIVAKPPTGYGFPEGLKWNEHSDGISSSEQVSQWLSRVGLGTALLGLGLTVAPVPGSRFAAAGLLGASATAGIIAASMRISDRVEHETFQWDRETALDILDIVGSLAGGTGSALSIGKKGLSVSSLQKAFLISEGVEAGTDLTSGIILSAVHVKNIGNIYEDLKAKKISIEEAVKRTSLELGKAVLAGGVVFVGNKVQKIKNGPDFPNLKDHAHRHSKFHTNRYYNNAVMHTKTGKSFKVRHNGQNKIVYLTRIGDKFIFTSTSVNGRTIFTHLEMVNKKYLDRKGISKRQITPIFKECKKYAITQVK